MRKNSRMFRWLALSTALWFAPAQAQNFSMPPPAGVMVGGFRVVASCAAQSLTAGVNPAFGTIDTTGALCVNATVSASVTGFTPNGNFATLTSTASSADAALPTGVTVAIENTGTTAVSCNLTVGAGTSVASKIVIQPQSIWGVVVGSNTHYSCINQAGDSASNVVVAAGGAGLASSFAGGGGGGGGGAVTNAGTFAVQLTGATNNINNIAGTISLPTGASTSANQSTEITALQAIQTSAATTATNTGAAIPTQSPAVPIGGVAICDGANGTTNPCTTAATVKPVSTAPVTSTDKALVVALRPDSPGIVALGQATKANSVPVTIASDQYVDPCQSPNVAKSSAVINISSATTTSLVAVSGSTVVYVCGWDFTISEVITTANTLAFEAGTGAACSSPSALTGTFGAGGITAGTPLHVSYSPGHTAFKSAASAGVCALTTIGATASFQGLITYVQQ